ncbi:MAG: prepilin-type N-terminal cleavage/methylation domain-containing protein [Acholeplasmataceae bacterium]|nr:prepilin-type N-terminal cleavage/methylation domain-containing protein [Acholeplasmataceae bacterium]
MTHKTQKGFTLVELIITMAILVILASVTFFGFRNYIVKANLSKDMETVTEINNIIRAQSVSDSFVAPADLEEARSLIDTITNDRFTYESRVDGYHFWFHLGRLEVMLSTVADMAEYSDSQQLSHTNMLLSTETSARNFKLLPEGFLYDESRPVLFLELEGSKVAEAINAFRQVSDFDQYQALYDTLNNGELDTISQNALNEIYSKTAFITNSGTFAPAQDAYEQVIFQPGIETITNQLKTLNEEVVVLDETSTLIRMSANISIPASVSTVMENALNVINPDDAYVLQFEMDADTLLDVVEPGFTNARFTVEEDFYALENKNVLIKNDETTNLTLSYKALFQVASFDLLINGAIATLTTTVSLNRAVSLSITNVLNNDGSSHVSGYQIVYQSSDEAVAIVNADGSLDVFETGNVIITAAIEGTDVSRTVALTIVNEDDETAPETYDFTSIDVTGFEGASKFKQTNEGISSNMGILFIEHNHETYDITVTATLDGTSDQTYGGFAVLIDTTLDAEGDDTGYAIQFDRGYNAIVIRPRIDGDEKSTILTVKHEDVDGLPDSKRDSFWTEEHTLLVQVRTVDSMPSKIAVTLYIDALKVIDNVVLDANMTAGTSVVGLRTWAVPTTFETLTIQGTVAHDKVSDLSLSDIIQDMLDADIFAGTALKYLNSNAAAESWSKRIEKYLEVDSNALTYRNRYTLENDLSTTYNQQAVINWHNYKINDTFDHPAFFITNNDDFSYDEILESKDLSRLLGSIIFYKTDDKSNTIFAYVLNTDGTLGDLESFDISI